MNIAIIGSGISGLYTGYYLKKNKSNINFDIFEKNNHIGGRIKMIKFDGIDVVAGAGIGRFKKDKLLLSLCKELNVLKSIYNVDKSYTFEPLNVNKVVQYLKKHSQNYDRHSFTFKQFAIDVLGKDLYEHFILSVGETDYENEDFIDALFDYGFELFNTTNTFQAFSIDWNKMLSAFYKVLKNNIKLNTPVKNLVFDVKLQKYIINNQYFYDKIVFATEINTITRFIKLPIYSNIKCQSFIRLYVKLDNPLLNYKSFIVTERPFQKIIEMNREKCIYMISYCDNKFVNNWKRVKNIKLYVKKHIKSIFNQDVNVIKHHLVLWECGTHFYLPLHSAYKNRDEFLLQAQNPYKNVFIVGEALSRDQGWCEGAIHSVHKIIDYL